MKRIVNVLGKLNWGTAFVLCAATAITLSAQTFNVVHSFDGTDGADPAAPLVQGTDGNLYGTTGEGGLSNYGTIFRIAPNGALTTLYSFCSQGIGCPGGYAPDGGLIQATNGDFYGTTYGGEGAGLGTVFTITPSGALTTLINFDYRDGAYPEAGVIQARDGNFYGTTDSGAPYRYGTVFRITPSGTLTTIHRFCGEVSPCMEGSYPSWVVEAADGNLYGTTSEGGAYGSGTVFKITQAGALTTLYSFCSQSGCPDGANPNGLVQAINGDFYGTTRTGGLPNNGGTIFRITADGALSTLYTFCSKGKYCPDGSDPEGGLVQATNGDFYGITQSGGANNQSGTIFVIGPSGLTTLYNFCARSGCVDGESPEAGLVQGTDGNLYGTTHGGGANGDGIVFSLSVGQGPFVKTQTSAGPVGTAVNILGTNLTGATSVSFNGTAAVFDVVLPFLITTTVPAGATSGTVQVVTPGGTLSSNAPFEVLP